METSCFLRSKQADYIDVDVYVKEADGSEWNVSIFKDMETGALCLGDWRWAETEDDSFEETDRTPGHNVWNAVIGEMPTVMEIIREAEGRWILTPVPWEVEQ